ncbi:Peptidase family M41 [Paracoccus thiocyanatus]|uniref:Peptidase family M41 n=1 Tax=Paracoccus thiocyanatus TaxID=34006 RepID=A0A1N6ZBV8_9RHOB|nr:AAA family ATPase [Paracoccus thiocyanatus]SIR24268.1 Peptidase family M41 [Paracoccus thiocyanatus]
MTQTIFTPTSNPDPESGTHNPPTWHPLARQAIRHLKADLAEKLTPSWDPCLDPEDMDLPELLEAAMSPPGSAALDALNRSPAAQNISPEEHDAIADAGGDPAATAANGTSQPRIRLPAGKLFPLLRLAASIGSIPDRNAMLVPGAITVIARVPGDLIDQINRLMSHLLPQDMSVALSPGRLPKGQPYVLLLSPDISNNKVSERAVSAFAADLARAVDMRAPIVILWPDEAAVPAMLQQAPIQRRAFAPLSAEILMTALRATHSATGRIDETAVRTALPNDAALSDLEPLALSLAMRAPSAKAVAERIVTLTNKAPRAAADGPWLEDIHGNTPALQAARQITRDLRVWKTGEVAWQDLTRTLLLYGPPGTGKSWIARAMGNSAGFSVVTGTFGAWQAAGHLGDMLREMRKCFAEARSKAPTVLIIDEIDAVGSREDRDQHNRSYRTQVINAFLAEMDAIAREEGVIVVGTCNHPDLIDPAVLRAGRFDMKVALPLPDVEGLFSVFRHCLPDWREADLRDIATRAVGCSAADVDAAIRQTRAMARGARRDMVLADLQQVFRITHDPEIDRRVALHECGHAITCAALRLGPVKRMFLDRNGGGGTLFDAEAKHGVLQDMQDRLAQLLAGRAAERLVLGDISAGAGGSPDSDLAQATMIATSIQTRYGLGAQGPVWTADPDTLIALDPDVLFRVRRELEAAEKRATQILSLHRDLLEEMARALAASRDMDRAEAADWLARVRSAAPDEVDDAHPAHQPQ